MRKGENISKDQLISRKNCSHRVIIPLYVPNEKDYYKDSFRIFEMCLRSAIKTAISPLKVSVISDACIQNVNKKLVDLKEEGLIDELIIESENLGKINSILRAIRNAQERLITISDADVLFLNDWEKAIIEVFEAFPNAGAVSPVPVFRTQFKLTSNIWMKYLYSKKLGFSPVKNPEALTRFAKSIGWSRLDSGWKDVIATLKSKNGHIAVIGSSHFVATYKREVFQDLPLEDSNFKLGGNSEYLYTDLPVVKYGGYRLATYENYAYHMGNTLEDWIKENYSKLLEEPKVFNNFENLKVLKRRKIKYFISEKIVDKIMKIQKVKKYLLNLKGLNKAQVKHYTD